MILTRPEWLRSALERGRHLGRRALGRLGALAVAAARGARALTVRLAGLMARAHWRFSPRNTLIGGAMVLVAAVMLYANCGFNGCPDVRLLTAYQPGKAPVLLDRYGERFADLTPHERVVVSLDSLPEYVPAAFVAVEDRRFWRHGGVDWLRVGGALLANLKSGEVVEGSSTIPMQLARSVFPDDLPGRQRTLKRKIEEVRVAEMIEDRFEKREILELYLNHIYLGGGTYGVEAASRLYFGKPARDLTLAEAATLAALPRAPAYYDPRRQPERARARRDLVLGRIGEQGLVDSMEVRDARDAELAVHEGDARERSALPLGTYFIDVVRDLLEERFGEWLYQAPRHIHTTLDPVAQRAAEQELTTHLNALDGRAGGGEGALQGAVVILEASTGDVLALVGGRDPATSRYNRAVLGARQLGSAFKPFVYAAALAEGIPTSHVLMDEPFTMQLSRNDIWQPSNYDNRYEGPVSLREALVRSRNVPTVRLATEVGVSDVAETARQAGIRAPMDETPALSLGTVSTTPLELAAAYTTFATLGRTAEPRFVLRVDDEAGSALWEPSYPPASQTLDAGVAYIITDILRDAVDRGTGRGVRGAGFRGPVAGKTGTTTGATDVWFVGYTPDVVGAVWIGYDRPAPIGSSATGGGLAAPVWGRMMREVYQTRPLPPEWQPPEGVVERRIDPYTGFVLQEGCFTWGYTATSEIFLAGAVPPAACPYRGRWSEFWSRILRRGRPPQADFDSDDDDDDDEPEERRRRERFRGRGGRR